MMYTSQGLMTTEDYQDYLKSTDQGTTTISIDAPPDWFTDPGDCPVCDGPVVGHDWVTVADASGEIISCDVGAA